MLLENQPLKSEEAEWDLKQAASIDGELKGFMEPRWTYSRVEFFIKGVVSQRSGCH